MQLQYFKVLITVFYSQQVQVRFSNWMEIFIRLQEDKIHIFLTHGTRSFQSSAIHFNLCGNRIE